MSSLDKFGPDKHIDRHTDIELMEQKLLELLLFVSVEVPLEALRLRTLN